MVTADYICDALHEEFFGAMGAANIDLKGFTEHFYKKVTGSEIQRVLGTIACVVPKTRSQVKLATLLILGENDDSKEMEALCRWVLDIFRIDMPLYFKVFHSNFCMLFKSVRYFIGALAIKLFACLTINNSTIFFGGAEIVTDINLAVVASETSR